MNSEVTLEQLRELRDAVAAARERDSRPCASVDDATAYSEARDEYESAAIAYSFQELGRTQPTACTCSQTPGAACGRCTTPPASGEVVGVPREFLEELAGYRGNMVNGNRLSDRARELLSAAPKQAMGWDADEGASPIGKSVLLCVEDAASGRRRVIRAMRAGLNTMELGCDQEWWEGCTTDEDEQEFCPAGWYERNEYDEVNWHVDDKFVAWMELPSPPEKAGG